MDWREKLFGKTLVRSGESGQLESVPTVEALAGCEREGDGCLCGIYFSFANVSDESEEFEARLRQVYERERARLRVVQVVLWARGAPGPAEPAFRAALRRAPWLAVPFRDVDTKRRLARKYNIAVGVPTLVLRGRSVREALLREPEGFPWPAPALRDVLRAVPLEGPLGGPLEGARPLLWEDLPADALRVFYFAAHWCPPCRAFSPAVCAALAALRRRRAKHASTQLILVSSDRSEQSYKRSVQAVAGAGGLALPWAAGEARRALGAALAVAGIPALVVTDAAGAVQCAAGRRQLAQDPLAYNFPWSPRPVAVLTEQALLQMARHPAIVLFVEEEDSEIEFAESVLQPTAESYYEECTIQFPGFCPSQSSSSDEALDLEFPAPEPAPEPARCRRRRFTPALFRVALEGSECADLLREHAALEGAAPLLTALDFPRQRLVTMRLGEQITTDSVQNFVDAYLSGNADFKPLKPYSEKC